MTKRSFGIDTDMTYALRKTLTYSDQDGRENGYNRCGITSMHVENLIYDRPHIVIRSAIGDDKPMANILGCP